MKSIYGDDLKVSFYTADNRGDFIEKENKPLDAEQRKADVKFPRSLTAYGFDKSQGVYVKLVGG